MRGIGSRDDLRILIRLIESLLKGLALLIAVGIIALIVFMAHGYYLEFRYQRPVRESEKLIEAKHFKEARELLEPIAQDYAEAALKLAMIHAAGLGVPEDRKKTDEFVKMASDLRESSGHKFYWCDSSNLSIVYHELSDDLRKVDPVKAKEFASHAAALGFDEKACYVGCGVGMKEGGEL